MNNQEKKPVRILHTADIHLDKWECSNSTVPIGQAQRALQAMVDLSIETEASLIIIAGDLFDSNRVNAATVDCTLQELLRTSAPVVILPGNHDCLTPDSAYRQVHLSKFAPKIRVFTAPEGERFLFPELDLAIWGNPITSHEGKLRPLAGVPARSRERWQIAVAHGAYVGTSNNHINSYQISAEEIAQSRHDYVALGHSSVFSCVSNGTVKAYYSGAASETGTVVIVDLIAGAEVQVRACPLPL